MRENSNTIYFSWDANGNLLTCNNNDDTQRHHCWDEENRLSTVADYNYASHYMYDAGGERVWKHNGSIEQMWINMGQLVNTANITNTTLYASPYMVINDYEYTKHYYIEGQRICSKLGGGMQNGLHNMDEYSEPLHGDIQNIMDSLYIKMNRDFECVNMAPENVSYSPDNFDIFVHSLPGLDENETDLYYYHSDHLGSSSFITDANGITTQHLQYLPFGELFVEQRDNANYFTPYKFSAKEKDEETSYSYFGARYLASDFSLWLSVDPLADKYPNISPYAYCAWNPVKFSDPTGMIVEPTDNEQVNNRINPNHKDYNKAFHEQYLRLDADQNAVYSFNKISSKTDNNGNRKFGIVTCNGRNKSGQDLIGINFSFGETGLFSKEATLLEETFHATQYMVGKFGFQMQNDGTYSGFAVDLTDEAEAQVFAAQNSVGVKSVMERALLKAYNAGGLQKALEHLENRAGSQGYKDLDKNPTSAEQMFRQYNPNYSKLLYNEKGQSIVPGIIMRKP